MSYTINRSGTSIQNIYDITTTNSGPYRFTVVGGGGGGGCGALISATYANLPANLHIRIILGGKASGNGGGGLTQVFTPSDQGATINIIAGGGGGVGAGGTGGGGDGGYEQSNGVRTGDGSNGWGKAIMNGIGNPGLGANGQVGGSGTQGGDGGSLGSDGYEGMGGNGGGGGSANGGVNNTNGITGKGGKVSGVTNGGINGGGAGGSDGGGGGGGWAGGGGGLKAGGGAGSSIVNGTTTYTITKATAPTDGYVVVIGAVASQVTQAAVSGAYNPNSSPQAAIGGQSGGVQLISGGSQVVSGNSGQVVSADNKKSVQEFVPRVQEGGSTTSPVPVPAPSTASTRAPVPTTTTKSESYGTMYIVIIIIVILLLAGGGGLWYYKNKK